VLVEARVLDREHRVLHDLRDLRDRHEAAPLFAEFTEENAVRGEDAHRQLRPVVGEAVDLGQVGVGDRERDRRDHHDGEGRGRRQAEQSEDDAQDHAQPLGQRVRRARSAFAAGRGFGICHTRPVRAIAL
jgi:hypothetical protein